MTDERRAELRFLIEQGLASAQQDILDDELSELLAESRALSEVRIECEPYRLEPDSFGRANFPTNILTIIENELAQKETP